MRRALFPVLLCLLLCACTAAQPEKAPEEPPENPPAELPGTPPPQEEETGPAVYTDWSKLGRRDPLPEPVGSRWYEDYTDELIPRDDYGPLVPYAGLRLMDDWPAMTGCLYGLMTREGVAVTDPVYSSVICPHGFSRKNGSGQKNGAYAHPLLVLKRADKSGRSEDWDDPAVYAAAARDGSWCTSFDYLGYRYSEEGLLLFREDGVTVMAPDGKIEKVWTPEDMGLSREDFHALLIQLSWGDTTFGDRSGDHMVLHWVDNGEYDTLRCFNLVTGGLSEIYLEDFYTVNGEWEEPPSPVPNAWFHPDSLLGYGAPGLWMAFDYSGEGQTVSYYKEDGTPLPRLALNGRWYRQIELVDGLVEILDRNTASYYDLETWECVFRTYLNYEED